MSEKRVLDINKEEDWWYSEPHTNHVTQTKKESIISEVLGDSYCDYEDDVAKNGKLKGFIENLFSFLF